MNNKFTLRYQVCPKDKLMLDRLDRLNIAELSCEYMDAYIDRGKIELGNRLINFILTKVNIHPEDCIGVLILPVEVIYFKIHAVITRAISSTILNTGGKCSELVSVVNYLRLIGDNYIGDMYIDTHKDIDPNIIRSDFKRHIIGVISGGLHLPLPTKVGMINSTLELKVTKNLLMIEDKDCKLEELSKFFDDDKIRLTCLPSEKYILNKLDTLDIKGFVKFYLIEVANLRSSSTYEIYVFLLCVLFSATGTRIQSNMPMLTPSIMLRLHECRNEALHMINCGVFTKNK